MTKEQIVAEFTRTGEINSLSHSFNATWAAAFKLYSSTTGDYTINQHCGSCYKKVMKWLKQN